MSKRTAQKELNHDNWDEEEDAEQMGSFKSADDDILRERVIKKAKRKNVSFGSGGTGGAFKGFTGLTSMGSSSDDTPSSSTPASLSIFGSTKPSGLLNGSLSAASSDAPASSTTGQSSKPLTNGHSKQSSNRSRYVRQLKALNESVTRWIRKHVEKNPYCILTPIFADYNKYLEEINTRFPEEAKELTEEEKEEDTGTEESGSEKEGPTMSSAVKPSADFSPAPNFKFAKLTSSAQPSTESSKTSTSVPVAATSKPLAPTGLFKSLTGAGGASSGGGFSFSVTKPTEKTQDTGSTGGTGGFSFAVNKPTEKSQDADGEETYEPPAPEVNQVTEDDAFLTQKCKLFFQKDKGWQEKGVGHLHLKPCGESTQLLIRADTSLGNVLLNIRLTTKTPVNRQGKNNVTLVCVPNPPLDPKEPAAPATLLIRVKTGDDADELLKQINSHK